MWINSLYSNKMLVRTILVSTMSIITPTSCYSGKSWSHFINEWAFFDLRSKSPPNLTPQTIPVLPIHTVHSGQYTQTLNTTNWSTAAHICQWGPYMHTICTGPGFLPSVALPKCYLLCGKHYTQNKKCIQKWVNTFQVESILNQQWVPNCILKSVM